jgi:hypothetical protein
VESFARALLLLLVAVLVLTYANHGPAGVKAQLRAKLLGRS